jgi:hypothetical protein
VPTAERKVRVFLCHASQDKPAVREIYQRLLGEGWIDPWLDEDKLLPGQDWDLEIEKAVEAAHAVIVCLSNNSVTKEGYIQRELKFVLDVALEKPEGKVFVIPVRLDDCQVPRRIRSWQWIDIFPEVGKNPAFEKILSSLRLLLPGPVLGEIVVKNAINKEFRSPRNFLTRHLFFQVSHKPEYELVREKLGVHHGGFSANFLSDKKIWQATGKPYHTIAKSNHLLITINLSDITHIPKGFWTRMPCDQKTLTKLLEEKKVVFGVQQYNRLYTLLVAANNDEILREGICKFLEIDSISKP